MSFHGFHWSPRSDGTPGQRLQLLPAGQEPILIRSDQCFAEVRGPQHKDVAVEWLEKLLKDELRMRSKRHLVQSQLFSEKLMQALHAYHNRAITTAEVIEERIRLANALAAASQRGDALGLTDAEMAFDDALARNDSALQAMGMLRSK